MNNEDNIELNVTSGAQGATEPVREPARYDITAEEDPMKWAMEFIRIREERLARDGVDIAKDPGTMVGWFSNAFARGEWNSPLYKEHVQRLMQEMFPKDSDPLDLVGTNTQDIGRPHMGGQYSVPVKKAEEWRRLVADKREAREKPLATLYFTDKAEQLFVAFGNKIGRRKK